jgi:hypothetical protein
MASVSVKFRKEEGPLLRVKAPVRAFVFPLAVGATYAVADGAALRVGSTLPWGLSWRLQFWPWGASLPPPRRDALTPSQGRSRPAYWSNILCTCLAAGCTWARRLSCPPEPAG